MSQLLRLGLGLEFAQMNINRIIKHYLTITERLHHLGSLCKYLRQIVFENSLFQSHPHFRFQAVTIKIL